jgi:hypothetical protein
MRSSYSLRVAAVVCAIPFALTTLAAQSRSPLADYPGFGHDRRSDNGRLARQTVARERTIRDCMQRAGFEYFQNPPVMNPQAQSRSEARGKLTKNQDYAAGLPVDRRREYNMALYGVPDPDDARNLWDPRSGTGGGCWGEAMRAYPSVYQARSELAVPLAAMRKSIAADSRVQQARTEWAQCMQAKGLQYQSPEALLATRDHDALAKAPDAGKKHEQAIAAAKECRTSSGLEGTETTVRNEKEGEFVRAHKAVLDRHKERQQKQTLP